MAIVTADYLAGVFTNFKALFTQELTGVNLDWSKVATEMPSDTDLETYNWLGEFPRMRAWKGSKIVKDLFTHNYSIKNYDYELTIGVSRNTFEDNKLGLEKARISGMARAAGEYVDYLVFSQLADALSTCYDGQLFYDTDHSEGNSGTQSNKSTSALSATTLKAGLLAMRKFKNDQGLSLDIVADTLVVPPDLEDTALELTKSQLLLVSGLASTSSASYAPDMNILSQRGLTVLCKAILPETDHWFLLSTKGVVKPVLLQVRKPNTFVALDQPTAENVFWRKEYNYGVEARYGCGYGLWQYAYGGIV